MYTTNTRKKFAVAVGAAIAGAAAPAMLFLGAGTAQAIQDSERSAVAIIDHIPTPRTCPGCGGFNPQPDPPGFPDPGSTVGIIVIDGGKVGSPDPGSKIGIVGPEY